MKIISRIPLTGGWGGQGFHKQRANTKNQNKVSQANRRSLKNKKTSFYINEKVKTKFFLITFKFPNGAGLTTD